MSRTDIENIMIGIYDFAKYIRNSKIIPDSKLKIFQDMSQPMTDYWIASSHNTYLEGKVVKLRIPKIFENLKIESRKNRNCKNFLEI